MRKILMLFSLCCCYVGLAQTDSLRLKLDSLFGNLDASQVPSGYLSPYGLDMLDK